LEGVTGDRNFFSDFNPTEGIKPTTADVKFDPSDSMAEIGATSNPNMTPLTETKIQPQTSLDQIGTTSTTVVPENINLPSSVNTLPETPFLDLPFDEQVTRAGDYMFRGGDTKKEVDAAKKLAGRNYATEYGDLATGIGRQAAEAGAGPNMLQRFGPSVLAGTAIAAGAGAFKTPEQEAVNLAGRNPDGTVITGSDLIDADPSKYLISELGNLRLNPETGEYEEVESMVSSFNKNTRPFEDIYATTPMPNNMGRAPSGPFARPYVQAAADGGPIFPRRNGGIAPTEGVQGQDSVRAMLMPGEFVMTTDAVRGLGNGNLNSGIQNMYSVMRNLESRGRNTA
jgi:hypothetical protein